MEDIKDYIILICVVSLFASGVYFVGAGGTEKEVTTEVNKVQSVPENGTVIAYGNLSEADKTLFRDAMSEGDVTEDFNTSSNYISLDGNTYQIEPSYTEYAYYQMLSTLLTTLGTLFILVSMGMIGSFYRKLFDAEMITLPQIGAIFIVLSVLVGGLYLSFVGLPTVQEESFIDSKVNSVANDTTVIDVNQMEEVNRKEFYEKAGEAPEKAFFIGPRNWETVDYIKSDGEYYRVYHKKTRGTYLTFVREVGINWLWSVSLIGFGIGSIIFFRKKERFEETTDDS